MFRFCFHSTGVHLFSVKGRPLHAVLLHPLSPPLAWWEVKRREERREGRAGEGCGCFAAFSTLPKNHFSSTSNSFPFSLLGACPAPALGIRLVYAAHYAPFAVAIATTRGQFIEGEEVTFGELVSFPAPVQSNSRKQKTQTPMEETH